MLFEKYAKKLLNNLAKFRIDPYGSIILNHSWAIPSSVERNALHMMVSSAPIITTVAFHLIMCTHGSDVPVYDFIHGSLISLGMGASIIPGVNNAAILASCSSDCSQISTFISNSSTFFRSCSINSSGTHGVWY